MVLWSKKSVASRWARAEAMLAERYRTLVPDLVHATDDVVVSEIESWQAVFGGKHVTVPV